MDERVMIERRCQSEMWTIDEWREDEDGLLAVIGRAMMLEDADPEMGPFEGEEGEMTVSVVGAEKHGNQRIHIGFMADGTSEPIEVRDPYLLDRI